MKAHKTIAYKPALGILTGIFLLAIISRFDSIISPSVAKIQASFPHDDPSKVESVVSIGASAAMVSSIIFGKLLERLSYKVVGIISCLCVACGGLMPLLVHQSVNQLLFFAIVAGFGTGIITTMLPSLASHFFQGKELSGLLGRIIAVQDGSSMIVLYLGGLLAVGGWVHNYWLYVIALLTLIPVIIFIPSERAGDDSEEGQIRRHREGVAEHRPSIILCASLAFLSIFLDAVIYNKLAIYVDTFHLGSSDVAGFALMFNSGASVVIGLLINRIKQAVGSLTLPLAFMLFAIGSLFFLLPPNLPMVCVGAFLIGSGSSIVMATCPFMLSNLIESRHYPFVMGLYSAFTSLGFTSSTWFFKFLSGAFGLDPLMGSFSCMLGISLVVALLLAVIHFQRRTEEHYLFL
ncbi:MFS transporter [Bifidobacterium aemilianum]|uniref:MFS transporter n=1 Tax=Bifidobacterium aemilianum TaxID=2493120 RepID=UPI001374BB0C|nr:MFS transporter [Bifidobacterium aemilianum]